MLFPLCVLMVLRALLFKKLTAPPGGMGKIPKEEKSKSQQALQENGMEESPVSSPKQKKKKVFSKEDLVSDPEETAAISTSLPCPKKSAPRRKWPGNQRDGKHEHPKGKRAIFSQGGAS